MTDLPGPSPDLDPLLGAWPSGVAIIRCHDSRFGATEFNPGFGPGRFHPFRGADREPVPTLYGSDTIDGAFSETIFHDVPASGPKRAIWRSWLKPMLLSVLVGAASSP